MNDKQVAKIAGVSGIYQKVFLRAYAGTSRAAGIKAFCLDCVGFVRSDITNCTALACPLYAYRPYQAGEDEEMDATAPDGGQDIKTASEPNEKN